MSQSANGQKKKDIAAKMGTGKFKNKLATTRNHLTIQTCEQESCEIRKTMLMEPCVSAAATSTAPVGPPASNVDMTITAARVLLDWAQNNSSLVQEDTTATSTQSSRSRHL